MGVDKIVIRAILSTLAAIFLLFAFMLTALIFIYPSTMMEITYDLGMDSASISFAETAYDRSDDVYYIAHATQTAIEIDDHESINACGERFITDDEFAGYCAKQVLPEGVEMSYEQFIYGQVCTSKYLLGQKTEAVNRAIGLVGDCFPKNNAIVAVLIQSLSTGDTASTDLLLDRMKEISVVSDLSETDKTYLAGVIEMTESELAA